MLIVLTFYFYHYLPPYWLCYEFDRTIATAEFLTVVLYSSVHGGVCCCRCVAIHNSLYACIYIYMYNVYNTIYRGFCIYLRLLHSICTLYIVQLHITITNSNTIRIPYEMISLCAYYMLSVRAVCLLCLFCFFCCCHRCCCCCCCGWCCCCCYTFEFMQERKYKQTRAKQKITWTIWKSLIDAFDCFATVLGLCAMLMMVMVM